MHARLRNAVVRWLLLVSVALGVVVMHHVTAAAGPTVHTVATAPMTGLPMDPHPTPDPGPKHDVLHLC
ncbi:MAG TPA: hypothetical protein VFO68_34055, partial [Actinophytocola sp.]|nr:hypothetical protein [Actinophytocola sp.]